MKRGELTELHFITPIANVASILQLGILSNKQAHRVPHRSVAKTDVQERRRHVVVPGGKPLHEYANLYLCGRNPMTYLRRDQHASLCILRISPLVIDLAGAIVTDQNAASDYAQFAPLPAGLEHCRRRIGIRRLLDAPSGPDQGMAAQIGKMRGGSRPRRNRALECHRRRMYRAAMDSAPWPRCHFLTRLR